MKTQTIYLDAKYNKVDKDKAVYVAIRQLNDSGKLVRESFGTAKAKDKEPAGKRVASARDRRSEVKAKSTEKGST